MKLPIFFLSFANDPLRPLQQLETEEKDIYKILTPAANAQCLQIHREPFANTDTISEYLMIYHNRIQIFHYGGHADGEKLFLKDQVAYARGLAYQLAQQKNLKLVFLNGCATRGQVNYLLELGIPAVIATSTTINDQRASTFAINFYQAVAHGFTLKAAFNNAAGILKMKTNQYPKIYRGWGKTPQKEQLPWGLYTLNNDEILDEQLIVERSINTAEKNVLRDVDIEVEGDTNVGDRNNSSTEKYNKKNIIERSRLKIKGGLNIGDK